MFCSSTLFALTLVEVKKITTQTMKCGPSQVMYNVLPLSCHVMLVIQEYDFDLGSGCTGGSQTARCLWPVTDVFQLKIHLAEIQSSCGGELISLFSVATYLVRAVRKFAFRVGQLNT
jgi:hypothetical protein